MTLPATARTTSPFSGNGVTTAFPFVFKVFAKTDITVVAVFSGVESTLVLDSDYSVALNADQVASPGGTVTYPVSGTPLGVGDTLTIAGALPYDQTTDLPDGGNFSAASVENAFDRTVMQIQQLAGKAERALLFPITDNTNHALPAAAARANRMASFDNAGAAEVTTFTTGQVAAMLSAVAVTGVPGGHVSSVEVKTVPAGTTLVTLSAITYAPGVQALAVYADGQRLTPIVDYTETSSASFTLTAPTTTELELLVVAGRWVTSGLDGDLISVNGQPLASMLSGLVFNVVSLGAVLDGVTADDAAVSAALAAATAYGGGTVYVGKPCAISSTITWPSNVGLVMAPGAKFVWKGSTSGVCMQTSPSSVCTHVRWQGLTIDTGASFTGTALYIHSAHNIKADVLRFISTGTTSTCLKIYADSTAGGDALTKRNATQIVIDSLIQHGQCGTLLDCDGTAVGYGGGPDVVTLNTIGSVFAENCAVYGIRLRNWTDNNTFPGMCRLTINANNGVGVQVGSATAQGVYMNQWGMLAVDTFGTLTGRVGMKIENSKLTQVKAFYQNPVAEGGEFNATAAAESYDVSLFRDSDKRIIHYRRLMRAASEGFNSSDPITIADDAAASFNVAEGGVDENITFILTVASNDANANGIVWVKCRRTTGTAATAIIAGGSNFAVTTGVLTGTTGVDTKLTVSATTTGRVYIENRLGATVILTTHISGWMQTP